MYKNILIPVLFDEGHDEGPAFEAARALADEGATFTVFHALEPIPNYAGITITKQMLDASRAEAKKLLVEKAKALPGAKAALIDGYAGRAIVDYANDHDVDCIVVASHSEGLSGVLLGSVSAKVVRHAKCTVHVIR
ncbi:MAG: universal stress protein [Pseudomonadota bacterium]